MKQKKVVALILAKNEEATIDAVIDGIKEWEKGFSSLSLEIAVVDDSDDKTPQIAKAMGAQVVKGENRGLGHSCAIGIHWALQRGADYVFTIDGDGQTALSEMERFWTTRQKTGADLVLGSRFLGGDHIKYRYPLGNRIGVFLLSKYLTLATGTPITDSHGGLRLYTKAAAASIFLTANHSYVQESILCVAIAGLKIVEIESIWNERVHGYSRVVHSRSKYIRKMAIPLIRTGSRALWYRLTK